MLALVAVCVAALGLSGCAAPVDGRAVAASTVTAGLDPSFVRNTDSGDDDRLAAAVFRDLEGFWAQAFPPLAGGRAFRPPSGYFSVDSSRPGPPPPCTEDTSEVEGNAFYCPRADVIAYDRAALLPVLREEFGDAAVTVVLAHEFGHAIQQRLDASAPGLGGSTRVPTILSEGQADCYAAVFLRRVRDGTTPDLRTGPGGVDGAMAALVTFRDPVGTGATDAEAHGNAFDRVSSFQMGFEGGPSTCAGMTITNRQFTQRAFSSLSDEQTGGNLPLDDLLAAIGPDLDRYFGALARSRNAAWTPLALNRGSASCDDGGDEGQGPAAFCPSDRSVRVDTGRELVGEHRALGDFSTGTLLASRFGLAALAAMGRPTEGADAGRRALCLAGAYTGSVGRPDTDFGLSPGDLDEAVNLLLRDDRAARGADGTAGTPTAYDRVADFRSGVDGGADRCLA